MSTKFMKMFSSCAMTVVLSFTSVATQAAEIGNVESSETLTIESCAANIKRIYTANYPEQADIIDDIVDTLSRSEEFTYIFDDEGATAFQIIEDSLHDALDPVVAPIAWDEDYYYTKYNVPSIRQAETTFCGVASMVMALMGSGKIKDMSNSATTDKMQYDYAKEVGIYTDEKGKTGDGVHIQDMAKFLQKRFPTNSMNYTYRVKVFTKNSKERIEGFLAVALASDTVPIIRVDEPGRFGYYPNNYKGSHYVVIESVDFSTRDVVVVDPHYSDAYYGKHVITLDELEDQVYAEWNLWMCIYTRTPDGEYEYEYN